MNTIKFIIIGPSGVGKTTLKKILFEQKDPFKLLNQSLEPTYGIDTTQYNVGKSFTVFDLAGQQISEWLSTSSEVFMETDMILLILDIKEDYNVNKEYVKIIEELRNKYCPNAIYGVFFHKIDLLPKNKRKDTIQNYLDSFKEFNNIFFYPTSIQKDYFVDTFNYLIILLRKCMAKMDSKDYSNIFAKTLIMNQFLNKNTIFFEDLQVILGESTSEVSQIIQILEKENLITVDPKDSSIKITSTGSKKLNNLKTILIEEIEKNPQIRDLSVKGLIISDEHGRAFLNYESQQDYFATLTSQNEYRGDPTLISMFFSAISDFGKTIDPVGFGNIIFIGSQLQIYICVFDRITGIFFFDKTIEIDNDIKQILMNFMKEFCTKFHTEIEQFFNISTIFNIETMESYLQNAVENMNILVASSKISTEASDEKKLFDIYLKLDNEKIEPEMTIKLRELITRYSVTKNSKILDEINEILDKYNIQMQ